MLEASHPGTIIDSKKMVALRVGVCTAVSICEGFYLAGSALVGPSLIASMSLSQSQFGLTATMMMAGFFFGAWGGGIAGDRWGRKNTVMAALLFISAFSALAATANDFDYLLFLRFCVGLGVGAAFPNILAVAASMVTPAMRGRAVTVTNCGGSVGGIVAAALVGIGGEDVTWRTVFGVATFLSLAVLPLLWAIVPNSGTENGQQSGRLNPSETLFGDRRTATTLLLWLANFCAAFNYYGVANWVPTLLSQKDMPPAIVGAGVGILSLSAIVGSLAYAALYDRGARRFAIGMTLLGAVPAIALFLFATTPPLAVASLALVGLIVMSGQLLIYAIVPACYPPAGRATGMGSSVAVGRLGAIISPVAIGAALQKGLSIPGLLIALAPCTLIAAFCMNAVLGRNAPTTEG